MKKLDILYEDKEYLVVNKPSKLLTVATTTNNHTLYEEASRYVKKQHKSNKIFIVHRLDKDTSGIVLFAKNMNTKRRLQENWNNQATRKYIAIVEGHLEKKKGILKDYLYEDNYYVVHVTNSNKGSLAITMYEVIKELKDYSILDITILTGKKHQIRVSLSNINHPIVGDKLYGAKSNPLNRLGLHAYYLKIKDLEVTSKLPKEFDYYIKK